MIAHLVDGGSERLQLRGRRVRQAVQRQQARVRQHHGALHVGRQRAVQRHRAVVARQLGPAAHRVTAQHAVGVQRQQLHGLGQHELAGGRGRGAVPAVGGQGPRAAGAERVAYCAGPGVPQAPHGLLRQEVHHGVQLHAAVHVGQLLGDGEGQVEYSEPALSGPVCVQEGGLYVDPVFAC